MFETLSATLRPFFAQASEAEPEAKSPWVVRPTRVKPKKDDDDDNGPTPTAGAAAWILPFFRPRIAPAMA